MPQDILSGTFGALIFSFLILLFILWFLLPFAVFGTKQRLDELIKQNDELIKQNMLLITLTDKIKNEVEDFRDGKVKRDNQSNILALDDED